MELLTALTCRISCRFLRRVTIFRRHLHHTEHCALRGCAPKRSQSVLRWVTIFRRHLNHTEQCALRGCAPNRSLQTVRINRGVRHHELGCRPLKFLICVKSGGRDPPSFLGGSCPSSSVAWLIRNPRKTPRIFLICVLSGGRSGGRGRRSPDQTITSTGKY